MRLGITSHHFNLFGVDDGARRIKLYGYDCCDYQHFVDTTTEFFNLPEEEFIATLKEQRAQIESHGITVHQAHAPWRCPPQEATPEALEKRFYEMAKAIRGTAALGAGYFVIHPFMPYGANSSEHADKMLEINRKMLSGLAEVARGVEVVVCLENMPFPLLPLASAQQITDFVREINHPNLKVCLDVGHELYLGKSPADAVRYIGKELLATMHVHDNYGKNDDHNNPGDGLVDWNAYAAALKEIGYDGVFSYETSVRGKWSDEERLERELKLSGFARDLVGNM